MKNLAYLVLSLTTVFSLNAVADNTLSVVNFSSLTDQTWNEIKEGQHPEIAVEFSADTTLPISFFLGGNLINLVEGKFGTIVIKQPFYARVMEQEIILSSNLTEWKSFMDFITGNLSITFNIQDGQPQIEIGAQAYLRN